MEQVLTMEQLLKTLVTAIVDNKEAVEINTLEGEGFIVLELKVSNDDIAKVIGKQGRIIQAIRTIMKAAGARVRKPTEVKLLSEPRQ